MLETMTRGIYVHIPFCMKKCNYCDFVSFPLTNEQAVLDYLQCLQKEIQLSGVECRKKEFTSIYFGGGTPTLLDSAHLIELLESIRVNFNISPCPEVTVETNPGTLTLEKAQKLQDAGFNRISIGVQSTSAKLLNDMGRMHTAGDVQESLRIAKKAGFSNINVDLIYGLPHQFIPEWLQTLQEMVTEKPAHIAVYGLKVEDKTVWGRLLEEGKLLLPPEDDVCAMYLEAGKLLQKSGYIHYEISNWAKPGYESKHNKVYWLAGEYVGVGLNAASYLDGTRFSNTASPAKYIMHLQVADFPREEIYPLSTEEQMSETMLMGLRLRQGVNKKLFKERFNCFPEEVYGEKIKKLIALKLLEADDCTLKLTKKGLLLANLALVEFV